MKPLQQKLMNFQAEIGSLAPVEISTPFQSPGSEAGTVNTSNEKNTTNTGDNEHRSAKDNGYTRKNGRLNIPAKIEALGKRYVQFEEKVRSFGYTEALDDYEKRKLRVFNQLNFLQLITGIIVPIAGLFHNDKLPAMAWVVACMPAIVSFLVLWMNAHHYHELAIYSYFALYPFATSIVYMSGMNLGVELFFILYGILSVFFLQQITQMIYSVSLSMISYFILAVVCKHYTYQLATANPFGYFFNELLAIAFIFYGLFLIKKENTGYHLSMLAQYKTLEAKNLEIQQQKIEIAENETLLKGQTSELTELNALKNKLFSVIAHDLRSPMYALQNLFSNIQQYDLPAEEIKSMVPGIVNDLTYTTSLMENLLQWARSQMQADAVRPDMTDISKMISTVIASLRLQAEAKHLKVVCSADAHIYAFADKDMISLVLRNLLSNAIKFTPPHGLITIGAHSMEACIEVFLEDTGVGIHPEAIAKINRNDYYTTKGTADESGTGLGLMLCKEFLARNEGALHIESEPGKGSVFSFTLPAKPSPVPPPPEKPSR